MTQLSPLQVSFRVVGLYCYFENLQVPNVSAASTVKQVMDAITGIESAFSYKSVILPNGKEVVETMSYDFSSSSTVPYNSSPNPPIGPRDLSMVLSNNTSLIWQYYRSVTGSIDGTVCEIKLISDSQESFATRSLNAFDSRFGGIPANFQISTYNLTWRLVELQLSPEKAANFMLAKANAIKAGY